MDNVVSGVRATDTSELGWHIEFSRGSMGGNQQLKFGDKYVGIVYECNVLDDIVDHLNETGFVYKGESQ